jgi:hypothetical protein
VILRPILVLHALHIHFHHVLKFLFSPCLLALYLGHIGAIRLGLVLGHVIVTCCAVSVEIAKTKCCFTTAALSILTDRSCTPIIQPVDQKMCFIRVMTQLRVRHERTRWIEASPNIQRPPSWHSSYHITRLWCISIPRKGCE